MVLWFLLRVYKNCIFASISPPHFQKGTFSLSTSGQDSLRPFEGHKITLRATRQVSRFGGPTQQQQAECHRLDRTEFCFPEYPDLLNLSRVSRPYVKLVMR